MLRARPATPWAEILSLMAIAAMTIVMTGLRTLMMEASIAVVMVIALRKENWVRNMPRKEATVCTSF